MNLIGSNLHKELRASRTKRDKTDISAITSSLKSALNPFDSAVNGDVPFNIRSGRQASDECASSLLSAIDRGKDARDKFLQDVIEQPSRFEDEFIKKMSLVNFV